jgi:SAM-dependent methyltransferase
MDAAETLAVQDVDRCALCAGPLEQWLAMPIDAIKNTPSPYANAMRCIECSVGSVRPVPSATEIAEFYRLDSYYTHGSNHIADVPLSVADRILIKLAWQFDNSRQFDTSRVSELLLPGSKVIDLGCGDGRLIAELQHAGFEVLGVEPDRSAQALGATKGVEILPGTAEDLPASLVPGSFDLVVMSHSLEHCRDPGRAVRNAAALLKPGGGLYCEVPNCAAMHFRTFTVTSTMFDAPRHLQFFEPGNLQALLEGRGFTIKRRFFSGYTRQFQPNWRTWEAKIWARAKLCRFAAKQGS